MIRASQLVHGPARPAPLVESEASTPTAPAVVELKAVATAPVAPGPATVAPAAARPLFDDLQAFLTEVPGLAGTAQAFPWQRLLALLDPVAASLEQSAELFWAANPASAPGGRDYLAFHQARVAVLAVRIGSVLGYDRTRRLTLGMAAALMDLGLWRVSPILLRRLDALTSEEQAEYRTHPVVAADVVARWAPPLAGVVEAILQHHEREHGQGFPHGVTGGRISAEAKVLGLVDTYASLTVPPAPGPGLRPHEALREIVRGHRDTFPAPLVKALLTEISVFPPGTLVRLNSGEVGRVVAVNRAHPLRPRVQVHSAKGQRLPAPKLVDLAEAPFLYITGPVSEPAW